MDLTSLSNCGWISNEPWIFKVCKISMRIII